MQSKKIYKFLTVSLLIQWAFIRIIAMYPTYIEKYYSNGLYVYISKFYRIIFGWIPISIGDILYVLTVLYILISIIKMIKNKQLQLKNTLFKIGGFSSVIFFIFYFNWGLNYFREPLVKTLGLNTSNYTTNDVLVLTKKLIQKTNTLQVKITRSDTLKVVIPYPHKKIYNLASEGYKNLANKFPQLYYTQPSIKTSLLSTLQSYMGVSGYLNPITGEAQVNNLPPKTSAPVTTSHEMAHQIGYAAENEANFIGFLAATHNSNIYFQYSGYKMALRYALLEVYKRDKTLYNELLKTINKGVLLNFKEDKAFYKHYQNPVEPYIKEVYNLYLKANKQDKGIESYNYVVDLLISYV